MTRIVAAFIGLKNDANSSFSASFQDAFRARDSFKSQIGLTFENYATLFLLGRHPNEIVLPSGWSHEFDDNRKECLCIYVFELSSDITGASGLTTN